MKSLKFIFSLLLAGALLAGCNGCKPTTGGGDSITNSVAGTTNPLVPEGADSEPGYLPHAQPKLPTIKVWVGAEELETEIASKRVEIMTGMMYRTNMPENAAMIFIFADADWRNFYMRNCVVPLSAGYIAPDGTLVDIAKLDPGDEKGVLSKSDNVQFVLEVPQGWFERHNIKTGAVIRTEKGTLQETFIRRR